MILLPMMLTLEKTGRRIFPQLYIRGKKSRVYVYGVLWLIVAFGFGLSFATSHLVDDVQKTSRKLLKSDVPKLENFSAFKSALLTYQGALDHHLSTPAVQDNLRQLEQDSLRDMYSHFGRIASEMVLDESIAFATEFNQLERMGNALHAALATHRDEAKARQILLRLDVSAGAIRDMVDKSRHRIEANIALSGQMAMNRTGQISTLVHLYICSALLSALCLVWHVRARLKSEDALSFLAGHDHVTQLPNRWSFFRRLEAVLRKRAAGKDSKFTAACMHLMLIEADRFDRVISGIGHAHADRLVEELSLRAGEVGRSVGAEVFRVGESKFAILLCGQPESVVKAIAAQLQRRMSEPFETGKHEIVQSLSIGSAGLAEMASKASTWVQGAESALEVARRRGGAYVAYSSELEQWAQEKLALEAQLHHSIERGELELYYQPQQRISDRALVGFEALLRWKRAGHDVSPAIFIPVAEESVLINQLGDWVLSEACRQAKTWNCNADDPVVVAINISPRQFNQPRFLERLREHITESGVSPDYLELEITEHMLMDSSGKSTEVIVELRKLGLRLAIDDFGTGYSSLSYLKRFPVHKLKIDQSFIRHLTPTSDDAEIVKAVISLGHNMGFSVIAEGVETSEQANFLAAWKCDELQGYHYGKPMNAEMATAFIESRTDMALMGA